jgi:hypothetical protein
LNHAISNSAVQHYNNTTNPIVPPTTAPPTTQLTPCLVPAFAEPVPPGVSPDPELPTGTEEEAEAEAEAADADAAEAEEERVAEFVVEADWRACSVLVDGNRY